MDAETLELVANLVAIMVDEHKDRTNHNAPWAIDCHTCTQIRQFNEHLTGIGETGEG